MRWSHCIRGVCQKASRSLSRSRGYRLPPAIRPSGSATDEHKRSLTPAEAIQHGADYLVVGRPIRDAKNRREMAQRIVDRDGKGFSYHVTGTLQQVSVFDVSTFPGLAFCQSHSVSSFDLIPRPLKPAGNSPKRTVRI